MQNKEIEDNRIPKEIAKALGIEKEDTDSLIVFKESLFEKTVKENIKLKQYIEQLENKVKELKTNKQEVINRLESDIPKITKTLQDGKHSDDYSKCRLKAYRTKTKEILSMIKGEKKW